MKFPSNLFSRLKIEWGSLAVAFLIACFLWAVHDLSGEYSAYFQYRVHVVTNIEGYSPESTSNETLMVRGRGTGFHALRYSGPRKEPVDIEVALDQHYFKPVKDESGTFSVLVSEARDKIVESLGEQVKVDFIETETLTFTFVASSFVKVPVEASLALSFKPQYMLSGDIVLSPDSVLVYGSEKDLSAVTKVSTSQITFNALDKNIQGYVTPEQIKGVRIDADKIRYSIRVERYFEVTEDVPVRTVNVPSGKQLRLLPSQVKMTYRVPFSSRNKDLSEDFELTVDYLDFTSSRSSKMIPKLSHSGVEILSYSLEPKMVECILSDEK